MKDFSVCNKISYICDNKLNVALYMYVVTKVVNYGETTKLYLPVILNKIFSPRLTCLETTGKIVPGIIRVNAMCIESESLMSDSAVLGDDVTLGFRIAEFINMYQVTVASPSLSFAIGQPVCMSVKCYS